MILFPNAKINIGLDVIRKRDDNYHDLETIFYPVTLCDILELNIAEKTELTITGTEIEGNTDNNLVIKAYRLLAANFTIPPIRFHLHKQIPTGAGLGGGSSDAAFTLIGLNKLLNLNLDKTALVEFASQLGSDCPFFILNHPVFAEGRGEIFSSVNITLGNLSIVLIKPPLEVSTAQAYSGIKPVSPLFPLKQAIEKPVDQWRNFVFNRFEDNIFRLFPEIEEIKTSLYRHGALYASMSGSGSTVYGLFSNIPENLSDQFPSCFYKEEKCRY